MFSKRDYNKISFLGVGLALILFGAIVCAIGLASWLITAFGLGTTLAFPFFKVMGGVVILGIGYIILEIELLRKK
ncbi:MAG: hypothetical protein ABSE91_00895 [Patescibacteria group bacterium]|jgi:hypothetical protein